MSLTSVAKKYHVSRATVCRLVNESGGLKKLCVPQPGNEQRVVPRLNQVICRLPRNFPIKNNPMHDAVEFTRSEFRITILGQLCAGGLKSICPVSVNQALLCNHWAGTRVYLFGRC